jgi:hypothetical protein
VGIQAVAHAFVCLRITRMNRVDLNLLPFDYGLTGMELFMDADGRTYSRFGGRDASSAEGRLSTASCKPCRAPDPDDSKVVILTMQRFGCTIVSTS